MERNRDRPESSNRDVVDDRGEIVEVEWRGKGWAERDEREKGERYGDPVCMNDEGWPGGRRPGSRPRGRAARVAPPSRNERTPISGVATRNGSGNLRAYADAVARKVTSRPTPGLRRYALAASVGQRSRRCWPRYEARGRSGSGATSSAARKSRNARDRQRTSHTAREAQRRLRATAPNPS